MGKDAVIATVFPDSNKKYLTTDLLREEPVRDGYLTPDVTVTGFRAFPRVCAMCLDQPEAPIRR
jgi:cysteine synthase A